MSYFGRRLAQLGALSEKAQRERREARLLLESEAQRKGVRAAGETLRGRPLSEDHRRKLRGPRRQFGLPPRVEREKI